MGIAQKRGRGLLTPPQGLRVADMVVIGCIMVSCFFLFQFGDIDITATVSYSFLKGHFLDFYSYCKETLPPMPGFYYLQPIYLVFAAWNLPMMLLGLTGRGVEDTYKLSVEEVAWNKLLPVFFLALCCVTVYKIARLIAQQEGAAKLCTFLFIASPLTIFTTFIFGAYDVVGLTFILLGLHAFLRQKQWRFILWFSLAILFKYYALLAFLPLLLLDEKNVWKILRGLLVAVAPTLGFIALSLLDPGGADGEALKHVGRLVHSQLKLGPTMAPAIIVLVYLSVCLFAHFKCHGGDVRMRQKYAVLLPLAAFSVIFVCTHWNMQYTILIAPFMALGFLFSPNRKYSLLLETACIALLFVKIFTIFGLVIPRGGVENPLVDPSQWILNQMVYFLGNYWVIPPAGYGALRGFFQAGIMNISSFIPYTSIIFIDGALLLLLLSPFLLQFLPQKKGAWPMPGLSKTEAGLVRLRCYGGLAAYFLPITAVSALYTWLPGLFEKVKATILWIW